MGLNSPLPVRLQEETRKAANIIRSFMKQGDNGLDRVIPKSVFQNAVGFAIFTVVKAGFVFSARAGSGIVIARLDDGSWSAPSAIGLGGFGFGGQMGAEVTDFLIVLNSRSAVTSFMTAGSLTLGGNLSVALGPLGRNAEGSGAVNSKGGLAAMYSYSKTKGLFGGVSVEGSVIVERQDANRLAYGGNLSVKQILSGEVDQPEWMSGLVGELERCTGGPGGGRRKDRDEGYGRGEEFYGRDRDDEFGRDDKRDAEDDYRGGQGGRERSGSGGNYAFGDGYGGGGNTPSSGRKRSSSLFGNGPTSPDPNILTKDRNMVSPRPSLGKRASSIINTFSSGSGSSPRKPLPSSESYNAGLTWDSSGPVDRGGYGRNRSGSRASALRNDVTPGGSLGPSPFEEKAESDLLGEWGDKTTNDPAGEADLLGAWGSDDRGLATSFGKMSTGTKRNRSRSNSKPTPFQNIEEDDYVPVETESRFAKADFGRVGDSPDKSRSGWVGGKGKSTVGGGYTAQSGASPFGDDVPERRPFEDYVAEGSQPVRSPPPRLPARAGMGPRTTSDGYAKAIALFPFKATDSGDLGLTKGAVVSIMDKVGEGEWWKGQGADGRIGIFPRNYVEVVEIPKDLKGGVWRSELKARMGDADFEL